MQESQDFKFVVQTLTTTNVIPYENIQSQTLNNTNSCSKRKYTSKQCRDKVDKSYILIQ
jgi:hypothetical protein